MTNPREYFRQLRTDYQNRRGECIDKMTDKIVGKAINEVALQNAADPNKTSFVINLGNSALCDCPFDLNVINPDKCPNTTLGSLEQSFERKTGVLAYMRYVDIEECPANGIPGFLGYNPRPRCQTRREVELRFNLKDFGY